MNKTIIQIEVSPELLAAIDARAELAGLSRERLVFLDTQFTNTITNRPLHKSLRVARDRKAVQ